MLHSLQSVSELTGNLQSACVIAFLFSIRVWGAPAVGSPHSDLLGRCPIGGRFLRSLLVGMQFLQIALRFYTPYSHVWGALLHALSFFAP